MKLSASQEVGRANQKLLLKVYNNLVFPRGKEWAWVVSVYRGYI